MLPYIYKEVEYPCTFTS